MHTFVCPECRFLNPKCPFVNLDPCFLPKLACFVCKQFNIMYKAKQTLSTVLIAMAMSVQAQSPATELVNNNPIIHNERGISIDLYGDYTLVGTNLPKYGTPAQRGGLLFYQNQYIRPYYVSNTSDKA